MISNTHINILVACGKNKIRSKTAEDLFKNDPRFNIRSVGVSSKSQRKINEKDLQWASRVFVMEKDHKQKITKIFRHLTLPEIEVLFIEDVYEYGEERLVSLLEERLLARIEEVYAL